MFTNYNNVTTPHPQAANPRKAVNIVTVAAPTVINKSGDPKRRGRAVKNETVCILAPITGKIIAAKADTTKNGIVKAPAVRVRRPAEMENEQAPAQHNQDPLDKSLLIKTPIILIKKHYCHNKKTKTNQWQNPVYQYSFLLYITRYE